jgi:hypothetical protein
MKLRKIAALGLALLAPMGLSGCLILPGEFVSEMTVLKTGEFSFAYKGQIQLLGLASLLNNSLSAVNKTSDEFTAVCYAEVVDDPIPADDAVGTEPEKSETEIATLADQSASDPQIELDISADLATGERLCTDEEVAQKKSEWDEQQKEKKQAEAQVKRMAAAMLGGIDPSDPKTIDRFAREVERLAAWHKVEHLGNGLFMIDYSTKGKLADDFAFPVIPRYAIGEPMIHITRWDNGRVRVEAPAFHGDTDLKSLAMIGGSAAASIIGGNTPVANPVAVSGTFTLLTDSRILANNSEEGPEEAGNMQKLRWEIGPKIFGPPMALLKMVQ